MPDTNSQSLSDAEIEACDTLDRDAVAFGRAVIAAHIAKQREMDAKAEPRTYYFHRFVDGQKMAEDVEVELADSEQEAIATALRICPKRPMTVLVLTHPPAAQAQPIGYISPDRLDAMRRGECDTIPLICEAGAELTGALGRADVPVYLEPPAAQAPASENLVRGNADSYAEDRSESPAYYTGWRDAERYHGIGIGTAKPAQPRVTEFNVGQWCLSEDDCIAQGIDFAAYELGVADAAKAMSRQPAQPSKIAQWAKTPEAEASDWHKGYEAARAWVKMQLDCSPAQPAPERVTKEMWKAAALDTLELAKSFASAPERVALTDEQIDAIVYAQCPDFDDWHEGPSIDDIRAMVRAAHGITAPAGGGEGAA